MSDPVIAMDTAKWANEFSCHHRGKHPGMGLPALSFVRKTRITLDDSGPVNMWCEGTAQNISAGGQNAQEFLKY